MIVDVSFGDSFAKWVKLKREEQLENTIGKSVPITPVKILPRSLETSLSYSLFSFCHILRFNFGHSLAKWVKLKKGKIIGNAIGKGVHETFQAVIIAAFQ